MLYGSKDMRCYCVFKVVCAITLCHAQVSVLFCSMARGNVEVGPGNAYGVT